MQAKRQFVVTDPPVVFGADLVEVFGLDLAPVMEGDVFDVADALGELVAGAAEDPVGVDLVGFGGAEDEGDAEGEADLRRFFDD